eukprot:452699_1
MDVDDSSALFIETKNKPKGSNKNRKYGIILIISILLIIVIIITVTILFLKRNTENVVIIQQMNGWEYGDDIIGYKWSFKNSTLIMNETLTNSSNNCKIFCRNSKQNNNISYCSSWNWNTITKKCVIYGIDLSQSMYPSNNIISGCGLVENYFQKDCSFNNICLTYENQLLSINGSQRLLLNNGSLRCYLAFIPPKCMNNQCSLSFINGGYNSTAIYWASRTFEMRQRMLGIHSNNTFNWRNPSIIIYTQQSNGYAHGLQPRKNVCKRDDVKYIVDIIDDLKYNLNVKIDENKIYSIGFSNGAVFTHYLQYKIQIEYNYTIAAIATAGGIYGSDFGVNVPKPLNKISVINFHGYKDTRVSIYGRKTESCFRIGRVSAIDMMSAWSVNNKCDSPIIKMYNTDNTALTTVWNCPKNVDLVFYSPQNMTHSWSYNISIQVADFLENKTVVW